MSRCPTGALFALSIVLLAGCATPVDRPPAALPAAAQAAAWQAPRPPADLPSDPGAARPAGWPLFDDPLLNRLVEAAQAGSPNLAAAQARIARARASLAGSEAQGLPQVEANASAQRSRSLPASGGSAAGAGGFGFGGVSNSRQIGLQSSWEIDLFGGVAASVRAAAARLRNAEAGWHAARVALAAEVGTAYISLRACEAQLVQTEADARSREATARLSEQSARAGFTAPADAALARAGAAQAASAVRAQQAQCDTLVKGLVELSDWTEPALRRELAEGAGRLPQTPGLGPLPLPAELLGQRPDVDAARAAVEAAAADADLTRRDEKPRLSLGGSIGRSVTRGGGFDAEGGVWSLGPLTLSLPLFDGGRRRAASAGAEAAYDEALAQLQGTLRQALREVETALVALDASAAREPALQAAAEGFEAARRATEARQRGGLASLLDLETARRNALQARGALIEVQRERASAWITLYRSLGGGWRPDEAPRAAARAGTPD